VLAKDVKRLGLDAKIVCLNYCASEVFLNLAGSAAEGMIGVQPFTPTSIRVPGDKTPADWLKAHGSSLAKQSVFYVQGWYTMALMAQGIQTLIAKKQALTGPNLKQALETMPAFLSGGVAFPIKFGASGNNAHDGMKGSRLYIVKKGKFAKLTGFIHP
jgi:branched-chain amino acid transport system substrate-binding protein